MWYTWKNLFGTQTWKQAFRVQGIWRSWRYFLPATSVLTCPGIVTDNCGGDCDLSVIPTLQVTLGTINLCILRLREDCEDVSLQPIMELVIKLSNGETFSSRDYLYPIRWYYGEDEERYGELYFRLGLVDLPIGSWLSSLLTYSVDQEFCYNWGQLRINVKAGV